MTPHLTQGGRRLLGLAGILATSLIATASELPTHSGFAQVDWKLEDPAERNPIVETTTASLLKPAADVTMQVRAIGVGARAGQLHLPVDATWSIDGKSAKRFFYGDDLAIEDDRVLVETPVAAGETIEFSARVWNQGWQDAATTGDAKADISVLRDGDPAAGSAKDGAANLLAPFLDKSGKLELDPRERIVVWHDSDQSIDFAILVRFD